MKKNIISVSVFIVILFGCNNSNKNEIDVMPKDSIKVGTDVGDLDLYSSVKELKQTKFRVMLVNDEIVKRQIVDDYPQNYVILFNEYGMITQERSFNADGSTYSRTINKYDSTGNKIETDEHRYKDNFITKDIYKYDDSGKLIEERWLWDNKLYSKTIYIYDSSGKKLERNTLHVEGAYNEKNEIYRYKYEYDNRGNLLVIKSFKPDGNVLITKKTYDYSGNIIESKDYDPDKNLNYRSVYIYDKSGKEIEYNGYNKDNKLSIIMKYYDNQKKKEYIFYSGDYEIPYIISKFNKRGEEVEEIRQSKDRIIQHSRFTREYDKIGNWIKKLEMDLLNDVPEYITEREIIYY